MRAFDMTAGAFALDVPVKWLDNLLSHHRIPGVAGGRQGVRRRLQPEAILRIAIAIRLLRELGLPVHRALDVADRLRRNGSVAGEDGFELRIDVDALSRRLEARLADVAESALPRRRGRPRRRASPVAIPD